MTLAFPETPSQTASDPLCRPVSVREPSVAGRRVSVAPAAVDVFADIPADFRLASGERLPQGRVSGRLHGPAGAPLIIVAGGISSDRFVHRTETRGLGWWSGAVAPGAPVDLTRFQVLAFDFVPDFGPAAVESKAPLTVTTHDQARLVALLLDRIEAPSAAVFIGCSYGGMIALAFAELFPDRVEQLVVVSAAHRPHPLATAWRGVQRRILQLGLATGRTDEAISLARELAMTTYRTPEEFGRRFDVAAPDKAGQTYPVCDYLRSRGRAYRDRTSPSRWLTLSDSIDRHAVTPEAIRTPTTLIGFTSDRLCPIEDMQELADRLPALFRFVQAPSLYGHDAFLKEDTLVADILRAALKDIAQ